MSAKSSRTPSAARLRPTAQRLPLDVLSLILEAWYNVQLSKSKRRARRVPFFALAVCSSWRHAAQRTHRLWTEAWFSLYAMLGQPRWLAYQECYARFSGAVDTNRAHIFCDFGVVPVGDPAWELFRATILPRARTIDVEIHEPAFYTDVLVGLTLPALSTLRVTSSHYLKPHEYPNFKLYMRAPRLVHVSFVRTLMAFEGEEDEAYNPIRGVETVELERAQFSLGDLRDLASMTPRLVDFKMNVSSLWDTAGDLFVWTQLEVLRVEVYSIFSDSLPHRLQLPALRLLEIMDVKYNWGFWREFIEGACPVLEELCVTHNHKDHAQDFVDGMGGLRQIRSLILRDGSLNEHIVDLLALPQSGGEIGFPNLRRPAFDKTAATYGFHFPSLEKLLQLRYAHLERTQMGGSFDLRCTFHREKHEGPHHARHTDMEVVVSGWNAAARQAYGGC